MLPVLLEWITTANVVRSQGHTVSGDDMSSKGETRCWGSEGLRRSCM